MNLFFVRHGQKDTGEKVDTHGHYHRILTEMGVKQAEELGKYLQKYKITKIFTSDMARAIQTGEAVNKYLNVSYFTQSPDLREADPCLDPQHPERDEIKVKCWQDWDYKPDNTEGESYNEGKIRFKNYLTNTVINNSKSDENILVVTHGRVLRLFLSDYLPDGKEQIKEIYKLTALTHIYLPDTNLDSIQIKKYNDNSYLPVDLQIP